MVKNRLPVHEDACGVGILADLNATPSHSLLQDALTMLINMSHRGGIAADGVTGANY